MINKNNILGVSILFTLAITLSGVASALPAGQNQLRLQTGASKRTGETAFSYLVSWRKGDLKFHRSNALIFINGSNLKKPTSDVNVARKITNSINAGVAIQSPVDRGALAKYTQDKAEVLVSNKTDFDLTHITVRDYSNQELHYNIPGKSFMTASVGVAIDLVYSAVVEYVDGFSTGIKKETAGGTVTVTVDNNSPIVIKTDNKSTRQIETELAQAMGGNAHFSSTPIYPNFVELRSKNFKPFDGGEVQLPALNAKSITIDINDSGLGVLTKFDFPDVNKPTDVIGKMPYILGFLVVGIIVFAFYTSNKKNRG
ncbi:MAG: hypothetical protein ACKE51_03735 [Methylococcaceae bacterium]